METIGQRLKKYRLHRQLSLKQTAELVGVSASTYRDWEYGKAIQGEPYEKLAEVFQVSLVELITGKLRRTQDLKIAVQALDSAVVNLKKIVLSME